MDKKHDLGIFLIRLVLGVIFLVHGWLKWTDMPGTVQFFSSLGLASFWAYLVATVELLGGAAMILGWWQKWAGRLLAIVMVVAIMTIKGKMGFVGGYELDLMLLATALGLSLLHPDRYAVKRAR